MSPVVFFLLCYHLLCVSEVFRWHTFQGFFPFRPRSSWSLLSSGSFLQAMHPMLKFLSCKLQETPEVWKRKMMQFYVLEQFFWHGYGLRSAEPVAGGCYFSSSGNRRRNLIRVTVGSGLSWEDVNSWIVGKGEALRQCLPSSLDNKALLIGNKERHTP